MEIELAIILFEVRYFFDDSGGNGTKQILIF